MKLTIFGATGRTGQHLVQQALQRGCAVTAFTRTPEKLQAGADNLEIVQGDVKDADQVKQAVAGADAVISVLGPTENKPVFAVTKGMEHILAAMKAHGVERLVMSAGAGVSDSRDGPTLLNRLINFLLRLSARWVYEDMQRAVELVRASDLKWTVVRVPMLTDDEPSGRVKAGYVGKGMGMRVTRADLARFMLDQVDSEAYVREAPAVSSE